MVADWVKSLTQAKEDRRPLFERLMQNSYKQSYGMAYRLTLSSAEAEDLLQETYLRAFRFFHRYDESLPFTSWLYRIMLNIHIDSMRRKNKLKTFSIDQSGADGGRQWDFADESSIADLNLMESTLEEPLQLGLKSMSADFRMAVVLADIEGMSYEEIADVMETSVGTVRSRIHRGRKQLRDYLVKTWPGRFEERE